MAMAHAKCTCEKCGEEFEVVVKRSNRRDADSFEAWAAENITVCPACQQRERDEEHKRDAEAAKQKADEQGLPELRGSEKQIRWALSIRDKQIEEVRKTLCKLEKLAATDEEKKILSDFKACAEKLFRETRAAYWIDSRYLDAVGLVKDYYKTINSK